MLKKANIKSEYLPHSGATPELFFKSAISKALFYRRAAGYFSSGVLQLFKIEILEFAKRGGKIQLVCSNQLAHEDVLELKPDRADCDHNLNIAKQVEALEAHEVYRDALSLFGTLLREKILKVKIAILPKGIFHDKTGFFSDDDGCAVSFRGSSNETYMGWSVEGNFETLETFCSWKSEDSNRVYNHQKYLERLWQNEQPGLKVLDLSEITLKQIISTSREQIDDFLPILKDSNKKRKTTEKYKLKVRTLKDFQQETLKNWKDAGYFGIIKHATGSGKTVTALGAINDHIISGKPAIICVPSILLLRQWREEINLDIPEASVLLCGGGHSSWKRSSRLTNLLKTSSSRTGAVIIVIVDTMVTDEFYRQLNNLDDILLIADEAHSLGSPKAIKITNLEFGKRLGLSATPERHNDPEGTTTIFSFFGAILKPIITIQDAIRADRLVNYIYHALPAFLEGSEFEEYKKFTQKIMTLPSVASENMSITEADNLKMLLIRRSRITKKAASKVPIATSLISKRYQPGEYWLIYCEDTSQLEEVNEALIRSAIYPYVYKSGMEGSKETELEEYIKNGGVMLSIKCLDEGVDIPRISHAVILASSQNPRQFIQRRGRVLRKDGIKEKAVIFDLFCIPPENTQKIPDALIKSELTRAAEFSKSALNSNTSMTKVREAFTRLGLSLDDFIDEADSDATR